MTVYKSVPEVHKEIVFVNTNTLPAESSSFKSPSASEEFDSSITTQDECMAVEALRQLAQLHTAPVNLPQTVVEYTTRFSCVHCNSQFSTLQLQQEHLSSCKYQHVCSVCGERFERSTDLDNHMVCHQVGRPHACRTCGNLFRSKSDLLNHTKCHRSSRTYNCSHCGITFLRPSSLTNHMKKHSHLETDINDKMQPIPPFRTLIFKRRECNSVNPVSVPNGSNLAAESGDEQILSGDHVPTDPLLISQIIHTPSEMFNNNSSVQELTGKDSKKPRIIRHVNDTSTKRRLTSRSMANGTDSTEQAVVKTEVDIKLEKNSRVNMNRPHVCPQCNKAFARSSALVSHARLHEDWWGSALECSKCEETFSDIDSLKQHQADCLGKVPTSAVVQAMLENCALLKKPSPPPALSKGKHICVYCNKRFITNQKLYRHMWIHRNKVYACSVCGLNFTDQPSLDGHCRVEHSGENAFKCQTCGQRFASRQVLCEHQRGVHRLAVFWCKICEKMFTSRSGYVVHVRIHTGERPYSCRYCRKPFRDTGTLRKHERIHTGERPHACPVCRRAFNQKVVLREHVRWVHAVKRISENKAYSCQLCRKVFPDHEALCAHIVEHSDKLAANAKGAAKKGTATKPPVVKSNPKRKRQKKTVRRIKSSSQSPAPEPKVVQVKTRNTSRFPAGQTYPHTFYPPSLTNTKNNQCDMCGATFQNRSTLLEHVRIHI
ncbi:zinc finger protein 271 [Anabrus simplex]|uniref:zinc finger protein 271 n=1 Tax=Anabrus simplex TaxID=316456 RepID=UPI0035A37AFE